MISTAATTFLFINSPFLAYNYMHIHWNEKEAIGTSVPMASLCLMRQRSRCDIFMAAFCDGKESGGGRTLELKAGNIDFHKLQ